MKNSDTQKQKAARTTHSQQPFFGATAKQPFFAGTGGVQRKSFFGAGPEHSFFSQGHGVQRAPFFKAAEVQAKLTVGAVGDKYEQEADRVAADVVARINGGQTTGEQAAVQRMGDEDEDLQMKPVAEKIQRIGMEEEEDLQMKPMSESIQRVGIEEDEDLQMKPMAEQIQRMGMEEEEDLQMKPTLQRVGHEGGAVSTDFESEIQSAKGGGQALAPNLQAQMGQAMGADFSGVRVHTDAQSDRLNQSIQAKAFTTGQDVFFRQGEYQPGSRGGQELIAHELTHVKQQAGVHGTNAERPKVDGPCEVQRTTKLKQEAATVFVGSHGYPVGKKMVAYLDPTDQIKGTKTSDTSQREIYAALRDRYPDGDKRTWHRGHMLNADLGGVNNDSNLAPLTAAMNTSGHTLIEGTVKDYMVQGLAVRYEVNYEMSINDQRAAARLRASVKGVDKEEARWMQVGAETKTKVPEGTLDISGGAYAKEVPDRKKEEAWIHELRNLSVRDKYSNALVRALEAKGWGKLKTKNGKDASLRMGEAGPFEELLAQGKKWVTAAEIRALPYYQRLVKAQQAGKPVAAKGKKRKQAARSTGSPPHANRQRVPMQQSYPMSNLGNNPLGPSRSAGKTVYTDPRANRHLYAPGGPSYSAPAAAPPAMQTRTPLGNWTAFSTPAQGRPTTGYWQLNLPAQRPTKLPSLQSNQPPVGPATLPPRPLMGYVGNQGTQASTRTGVGQRSDLDPAPMPTNVTAPGTHTGPVTNHQMPPDLPPGTWTTMVAVAHGQARRENDVPAVYGYKPVPRHPITPSSGPVHGRRSGGDHAMPRGSTPFRPPWGNGGQQGNNLTTWPGPANAPPRANVDPSTMSYNEEVGEIHASPLRTQQAQDRRGQEPMDWTRSDVPSAVPMEDYDPAGTGAHDNETHETDEFEGGEAVGPVDQGSDMLVPIDDTILSEYDYGFAQDFGL